MVDELGKQGLMPLCELFMVVEQDLKKILLPSGHVDDSFGI